VPFHKTPAYQAIDAEKPIGQQWSNSATLYCGGKVKKYKNADVPSMQSW
jgi:hypothetical protein